MKKALKSYTWATFYLVLYILLQFLFIKIVNYYKGTSPINLIPDPGKLKLYYYILNAPVIGAGAAFVAFLIYNLSFHFKKDNMYKFCRFCKTAKSNIAISILLGLALSLLIISIVKPEQIYNIKDFIKFLTNKELNESATFNRFVFNTISFSLYTLVPVAIIIPIFEEILFRGLVLNELRTKLNINIAILIQAVLFAIMHLNLQQSILTLFIGFILGTLYIWYDSIWIPIAIHMAYNFTSSSIAQVNTMYEKMKLLYNPTTYSVSDVINKFVYNQSAGKQANIEQILKVPVYFTISSVSIALTVIILCALYFWKNRNTKKKTTGIEL